MVLFVSILFEALCLLHLYVYFHHQIREVFFHHFFNFLPFLFSSWHPVCSTSLIWFSASCTLLLVPYKFFFISLTARFISAWVFFILLKCPMSSLSILITIVLNSASHRLLISILYSSFSGVLFCSFIWAVFLCLLILAASLCLFLCIR